MIQVGVVSWGTGNPACGDGSSPGVYSLVWSDRAFIEQHATGAIFANAGAVYHLVILKNFHL